MATPRPLYAAILSLLLLYCFPTLAQMPEGKAPNLVVFVHGCCTNQNDVNILKIRLYDASKNEAFQKNGQWEVVVWDWSRDTPKPAAPIDNINIKTYGDTAYKNAVGQGQTLANAIYAHRSIYKHIHLIGHSAGANLIHEAANKLATILTTSERPFIHLTFLDAYTPDDAATNTYGSMPADYPQHYSEHYVDIGPLPYTDAILQNAFNFDITDWSLQKNCAPLDLNCSHQWPLNWYIQSIAYIPAITVYKYGHRLSSEGGNPFITQMGALYPARPSGYAKTTAELKLRYPTPPEWPQVAGVDFPSAIDGTNIQVPGTVRFIDTNAGINAAQFDVLGDTCGGCFKSFSVTPGAINDTIGMFTFNMYCKTSGGFAWETKLTLRDVQGHVSSPYTFAVQCKPPGTVSTTGGSAAR